MLKNCISTKGFRGTAIPVFNGDSFDRQFARGEAAAARRAIAAYKREAAHGQDPDVKDCANQMIPLREKQLQLAGQAAEPLQSARAAR